MKTFFTKPYSVWRQHFLPQLALTQFAGVMSHCKIPWLKDYLINWFIRRYAVNMDDALTADLSTYSCFHDFFIRRLKPTVRTIDPAMFSICSPCDGTRGEMGLISQDTLLQAKGRHFSLSSLLGSKEDAQRFNNGQFLSIYLAPKDYHRVHMPCNGILEHMRYIPGKLFSVNPLTTAHVDNLFGRNERVVSFFQHPKGSFAVILVGAMLVGSIYTRWKGCITPPRAKQITDIVYPQTADRHIKLDKGEEMGYFALGSTVIILFTEGMQWEFDTAQSTLIVGQKIGHFLP